MDLLYVFEESGVGCEAHSLPDCLCDVVPLPEVPIRHVPRLAPFPTMTGSQTNSFLVWGAMTLGRFEALSGVNEAELNDALFLWEGRSADRADRGASHRVAAAHKCIRAGLTLEQTARWLSTSLVEILDLFYARSKHELILEMEKHIRAGKTAKEIAELTGCTRNYASDVARRWGVKIPHSGHRFSPADKAKARKLVKSGLSRREVARRLAISETRVTTWCSDLPALYNGKVSK